MLPPVPTLSFSHSHKLLERHSIYLIYVLFFFFVLLMKKVLYQGITALHTVGINAKQQKFIFDGFFSDKILYPLKHFCHNSVNILPHLLNPSLLTSPAPHPPALILAWTVIQSIFPDFFPIPSALPPPPKASSLIDVGGVTSQVWSIFSQFFQNSLVQITNTCW